MSALVVDTHAIVWYLAGDTRLSPAATLAIDSATSNGEPIFVQSICLVD
jgi:PIN domain nuclease of toxin-antitoxin system